MKKALLALAAGIAVSSAQAYDVWLGTHCMPDSAASDITSWSVAAHAMIGLDVNRTPCKPSAGTPNASDVSCTNSSWSTVLATLHPAETNSYVEIPKSTVANATSPESVYAGKFQDAKTYQYTINYIMIYNNALGGVNYNWSTGPGGDIAGLRSWLDANGHANVQIWFDGRGTSDEPVFKDANIDGAVVETSLVRWTPDTGGVKELVAWLYENTTKHITFQLVTNHDYPYQQPYAFQDLRNLVRLIGVYMANQGHPAFLSSSRITLAPCTYNDPTGGLQDATLQFAPQMVNSNTYANTLTSIALSLYEQKAMFEAGATQAECDSFSR